MRKRRVELCGNLAFRDRHSFVLFADTDGDARRSRKMQVALYAEDASTHSRRLELPHIPFQTDEFKMYGNFEPPPHLMKRVSHMLGGGGCPDFAPGGGVLSFGVLH